MRNTTLYNQAGTITFRRGSSSILLDFVEKIKCGTNLQNIEKQIRKIYHARKGYKLCQVDQSGAEALIVAFLCKSAKFRSLFLNNVKPHVFVGLHLFFDIWQHKINEGSLDIKIDLKPLLDTDIPALRNFEHWRSVDSLIKSSDNWPAQERYYYISKQVCHCVSDDTEVLTLDGWKCVSLIKPEEAIAIWNKDLNEIKFEIPKEWFKYYHKDLMYNFCGKESDQLVTDNHRILYASNGEYRIKEAKELINYSDFRVPNSSYYTGGNSCWPTSDIQLLVAIQADGYIQSKSKIRFRLVKQRKIDRLKFLANSSNIFYEEKQTDITEITLCNCEKFIQRFGENKLWNNWLLELNQLNLKTLIDELKYWDGTYEESYCHKREAYFSIYKQNVEWIKTVCHLVGKQGTISWHYNENGSRLYSVGINNRQQCRITDKAIIKNYEGNVFCPSTSTGYFLIRRHNKISITGNSSNYGIRPNAFALNTLEKSKGRISLTKQQCEQYLSFYHSLFPEIQEWHREVQIQLEATRTLYNLFGFPRYFSGELNDSNIKEAFAFVPQSTVGCITAKAYTKLQRFIEEQHLQWNLLADTHDSYLVEAPDDEVLDAAKVAKSFMEQDLVSPRGEPFKMKAEVAIGFNWAPYKEHYNEEGLKEIKL